MRASPSLGAKERLRSDTYVTLCALLRPLPARTSATPLPPDLDWAILLETAGTNLVTPALAWTSQAQDVPPSVADYLGAVLELSRARAERTLEELEWVLGTLAAAGLVPMLLKGAAALAEDIYPDPGCRLMMDLDLLLPAEQLEAATAALVDAGFRAREPERQWIASAHHDLPMLIHPDWPLGIELHRAVLPSAFAAVVDTGNCWRQRREIGFRGLVAFAPSAGDRIAHHIAHSQLVDGEAVTGVPQLRQFLDLAMLRARFVREIDWAGIERRFSGSRRKDLMHVLALSEVLLGQPSPLPGADHEGALSRLRRGLDRPGRGARLRVLAGRYARQMRSNPLSAINWLQPGSWRRRLPWLAEQLRGRGR